MHATAGVYFLVSSSLERVLMISSFLACRRSSRRFRASLVLDLRASAWSLRGVQEVVSERQEPPRPAPGEPVPPAPAASGSTGPCSSKPPAGGGSCAPTAPTGAPGGAAGFLSTPCPVLGPGQAGTGRWGLPTRAGRVTGCYWSPWFHTSPLPSGTLDAAGSGASSSTTDRSTPPDQRIYQLPAR